MLQTNLLGRQFTSNVSGKVFRVVAVYVRGVGVPRGAYDVILTGEDNNGNLSNFTIIEMTLIPLVPSQS